MVGAQLLPLLLRREQVAQDVPVATLAKNRPLRMDGTARHVQRTADGLDDRECPSTLRAVVCVFAGVAVPQTARMTTGEQPCRSRDLLRRHPSDLGDSLRWILFYMPFQPLEAGGPQIHELLIVEALTDDHVQHPQRKGEVGPRPGTQPYVRPLCRRGLEHVHHDQLGSLLERWISAVAPAKNAFRAAGQVGSPVEAVRHQTCRCAWDVAGVIDTGHVGSAEHVAEARDIVGFPAVDPFRQAHRLGSISIPCTGQLPGHCVERFLPRDALPFPSTPVAHSSQRVREPGGRVETFQAGGGSGAQLPRGPTGIRGALQPYRPAILNMYQDGTGRAAFLAYCPHHPVLFSPVHMLNSLLELKGDRHAPQPRRS